MRRRRRQGAQVRVNIPVVCVRNITLASEPETQSVIALLALLSRAGVAAHVVCLAQGRAIKSPLRVDERLHSAAVVGDESLQISTFGPCWVAPSHDQGVKAAIAAGAGLVILPGGFDDSSIHKDLTILVADAEAGFGNGRSIPAGPLRAPLPDALRRADVLLVVGSSAARRRLGDQWPQLATIPAWSAAIRPLETGMDWADMRCFAFAGTVRPAKFFAAVSRTGATIVSKRGFPDNTTYPTAVLQRLKAEARALNAQLVTTEKDVARLPNAFKPEVLAFPLRLVFNDPSSVGAALETLMAEQIVDQTL